MSRTLLTASEVDELSEDDAEEALHFTPPSAMIADLIMLAVDECGRTSYHFGPSNTGYEIRDAGCGRGLGVFATRSFVAGERVMCEVPLVRWSSAEEHVQHSALRKLVGALPAADQTAFFALSALPVDSPALDTHGISGADIASRIWAANAYPREILSSQGAGNSGAGHRLCSVLAYMQDQSRLQSQLHPLVE